MYSYNFHSLLRVRDNSFHKGLLLHSTTTHVEHTDCLGINTTEISHYLILHLSLAHVMILCRYLWKYCISVLQGFECKKICNALNLKILGILELRQFENDSMESRCMLVLKLPLFFPHCAHGRPLTKHKIDRAQPD